MDLFTNMKPGEGTLIAYKIIRDEVPHFEKRSYYLKGHRNYGAFNAKWKNHRRDLKERLESSN